MKFHKAISYIHYLEAHIADAFFGCYLNEEYKKRFYITPDGNLVVEYESLEGSTELHATYNLSEDEIVETLTITLVNHWKNDDESL